MQDIETEEALVLKVGGKFKLTALMQKRMVELNRGAAPLVEIEGDEPDPRAIVVKEILEGKIELAPRSEIEAPLKQPEERVGTPAARRARIAPADGCHAGRRGRRDLRFRHQEDQRATDQGAVPAPQSEEVGVRCRVRVSSRRCSDTAARVPPHGQHRSRRVGGHRRLQERGSGVEAHAARRRRQDDPHSASPSSSSPR